jgi:hypothetical protein
MAQADQKMTIEEFAKHIQQDSNQPHILLRDEALRILEPVFESFPFLRECVDYTNKYRVCITDTDFELFFLPAMCYCGIIDSYWSEYNFNVNGRQNEEK